MSGNGKTQDGIWLVPNIGLLRVLPCSEVDDGTPCWVVAEGDWFYLAKSDGRADDGVNIIAPLAGAPSAGNATARWLRNATTPLPTAASIGQALTVTSAGHIAWTPASALAPPTIADVANIAALAVLDDTSFNLGATVWMRSLLDLWTLEASGAAANGITIINAFSGGARRWHRACTPHGYWQQQATWHINPNTGNNEAAGTALAPIASDDEYNRRVGGEPLINDHHVVYDVDASDPAYFFNLNDPDTGPYIFVEGTETILLDNIAVTSTTFTDVTVSPPVQTTISSASIPVSWTASGLLDKILIFKTGGNAGNAMIVMQDLGGGGHQARVTQPVDPDGNASEPNAGDVVKAVQYTQLTGGVYIQGPVYLTKLRVSGAGVYLTAGAGSSGARVFACDVTCAGIYDLSNALVVSGSRIATANNPSVQSFAYTILSCCWAPSGLQINVQNQPTPACVQFTGTCSGAQVTLTGPLQAFFSGNFFNGLGFFAAGAIANPIVATAGVRIDVRNGFPYGANVTGIGIQLQCASLVLFNNVLFIPNFVGLTTPLAVDGYNVTYATVFAAGGVRTANGSDVTIDLNGIPSATRFDLNGINIGETTTSPTLRQDTRTTDTATSRLTIQGQSAIASGAPANPNSGGVTIRGGSARLNGTTGLRNGVALGLGGTSTTSLVEVTEVAVGRRVVAINQIALITATQMPANSGDGVMFIANAATNPTANSVGGGILYSNGGAGTWRGTGGTTTAFGPAEPHCPTCGRDYAFHAKHDDAGEELAICWPCMLDTLEDKGIDVSKFAFVRTLIHPNERKKKIKAMYARDAKIVSDAKAEEDAREAALAADPAHQARLAIERRLEAEQEAHEEAQRPGRIRSHARALEARYGHLVASQPEAAVFLLDAAAFWRAVGDEAQAQRVLDLALLTPGLDPALAEVIQAAKTPPESAT